MVDSTNGQIVEEDTILHALRTNLIKKETKHGD